jgi:hypothetical protein
MFAAWYNMEVPSVSLSATSSASDSFHSDLACGVQHPPLRSEMVSFGRGYDHSHELAPKSRAGPQITSQPPTREPQTLPAEPCKDVAERRNTTQRQQGEVGGNSSHVLLTCNEMYKAQFGTDGKVARNSGTNDWSSTIRHSHKPLGRVIALPTCKRKRQNTSERRSALRRQSA